MNPDDNDSGVPTRGSRDEVVPRPPALPSKNPEQFNPVGIFIRFMLLAVLLYFFFLSIDLMSGSFKLFSTSAGYKDEFKNMIAVTLNPLAGLCLGILMTAVLQSSSTTTSMIVAVVATGQIPISGAIPMIMGANVGTTVTSTLVALGHVTQRREFGLAISAATVHDFFNLLSVLILLPLELMTGFLEKFAIWLTHFFEHAEQIEKTSSPLKAIIKPVTGQITDMIKVLGDEFTPFLQLAFALALLMVVLKYLSKNLREVISGRVEKLANGYLFARTWQALVIGSIITILVQSSSISTSIIVPLVAGGVFTLHQVFPFLLGANIGTTITALLAALSLLGSDKGFDALSVAFVHLSFNLCGTFIFIWKSTSRLPIYLAGKLSNVAIHHRYLAIIYVLVVFFIIPLLIIFII
jgi:sodium-dependent phosphate cotransporter